MCTIKKTKRSRNVVRHCRRRTSRRQTRKRLRPKIRRTLKSGFKRACRIDLHLRNVGLTLPNGRQLFSIKDLKLPHGSHVLLRGASGQGKSSLLHLIAGLMLPSEGSITVGTFEMSSKSDAERAAFRRAHLGVIFQKLNLLAHLTVGENIELALGGGGDNAKRITSALQRVKLSEFANERAAVLSGGEQQRVAVARVLAQSADVILADEPTSSLDDENAAFVIDALKSAGQGKTLLVVSHDDRLAKAFKVIRTLGDL